MKKLHALADDLSAKENRKPFLYYFVRCSFMYNHTFFVFRHINLNTREKKLNGTLLLLSVIDKNVPSNGRLSKKLKLIFLNLSRSHPYEFIARLKSVHSITLTYHFA